MNIASVLAMVGDEPLFPSSLLLSGNESIPRVRLQLSRWVKAGKLLQLRRGLYAFAPAWRKVEPHPFVIANAMHRGSYVSLQAALAYYAAIPEHVPTVTSVGPGRPEVVRNLLGTFALNHVAGSMLFGYSRIEVAPRQFAFVASPEKALLDLVYLTRGADAPAYLRELRLQNPGEFHTKTLLDLAARTAKPKLVRAAQHAVRLLADEEGEAN